MAESNSTTVIDRLVRELTRLPGIGRKTAQRLVFHLLKRSPDETEALARALLALREHVRACTHCFNFAESDECPICSDPRRDRTRICVVEEPVNVAALERAGGYRGLYHVLGGTLSPLAGVGPDDLHIRELVERIKAADAAAAPEFPGAGAGAGSTDQPPPAGGIVEVILATNPTVEGEATAIHIANVLKPLQKQITRIAMGLPVGGDLEYTDDVTLARALSGRRAVD